MCCIQNDLPCLQMLFRYGGINLQLKDKKQKNMLDYANKYNFKALAQFLLSKSADANDPAKQISFYPLQEEALQAIESLDSLLTCKEGTGSEEPVQKPAAKD